MWLFEGKEFTIEDVPEDVIGFVYCITDLRNNLKYVGKKTILSTRKLPPLKGKTRKRTKIVITDWMDYYGSSEEVKQLVEEHGKESFKREILHLCKSKGEMSYVEMFVQVKNNVLLRPGEFYNAFVGGKIHRNHVKNVDIEKLNKL